MNLATIRPIEGMPMYSATREGRIWSARKGGFLNNKPEKTGYFHVRIGPDSRSRKELKVHRLVATAFIPNPENKPQINHKNGIKTDNRVENLEWVTAKENTKHAFDNKLRVGFALKGEACPYTKMKEARVREIRDLFAAGHKVRAIAEKFTLSQMTVYHLVHRNYWKHIP